MKKFGYFLLIFVPLILVLIIQVFASVIAIFMAAIISGSQGLHSFIDFYNSIFALFLDKDFNGMLMIIYSLISICVFGLWYYYRYEGDYLPFFHKKFKAKRLLSLVGIIILVPGTQFAASLICSILALIAPKTLETYEKLLEMAGLDEKMTFILFIYSVVLAPICEELVFRGVTLSCAKRLFPFWLANIIQAVLFGAFHMNIVQGVYAFALGIILGYVCEKGKSIYFSLLLHFLFNLWAATMTLIFNVEEAKWLDIAIFPITVASLFVGIILFRIGLLDSKKYTEAQITD